MPWGTALIAPPKAGSAASSCSSPMRKAVTGRLSSARTRYGL